MNSLPFIIELTAGQQGWTKVEFNFTTLSPGRVNIFSLLHIYVKDEVLQGSFAQAGIPTLHFISQLQ